MSGLSSRSNAVLDLILILLLLLLSILRILNQLRYPKPMVRKVCCCSLIRHRLAEPMIAIHGSISHEFGPIYPSATGAVASTIAIVNSATFRGCTDLIHRPAPSSAPPPLITHKPAHTSSVVVRLLPNKTK